MLTISEGDVVTGEVKVGPNQKNPRDIDVSLKVDFDGQVLHFLFFPLPLTLQFESIHSNMDYVIR